MPGEGVEVPPTHLALCISSTWLFPSSILDNKLVNVSKYFSEFCESLENLRREITETSNLSSAGWPCG